jgi:hypothetical protein
MTLDRHHDKKDTIFMVSPLGFWNGAGPGKGLREPPAAWSVHFCPEIAGFPAEGEDPIRVIIMCKRTYY